MLILADGSFAAAFQHPTGFKFGTGRIDDEGKSIIALESAVSCTIQFDFSTGRFSGEWVQTDRPNERFSGVMEGRDHGIRLVNLSVRTQMLQSGSTTIAGFVTAGSGRQRILGRAIGPT
ncbi:MAG: hypothetical protein HC805_07690 [Alkalinema sp. RL_2_19]|nr:hypothetical protein [Alkalinema sp. RL_2_19]